MLRILGTEDQTLLEKLKKSIKVEKSIIDERSKYDALDRVESNLKNLLSKACGKKPSRPKVHTAKFDRCVAQTKGKVENPFAVCGVSLGKEGIKEEHQAKESYARDTKTRAIDQPRSCKAIKLPDGSGCMVGCIGTHKSSRPHTPIVSKKQRGFFGAELARKRAGEKGQTDMPPTVLERHLKEVSGKDLPKVVKKSRTMSSPGYSTWLSNFQAKHPVFPTDKLPDPNKPQPKTPKDPADYSGTTPEARAEQKKRARKEKKNRGLN